MALTFCCSSGCGIIGAGAAPGTGGRRHWDALGGTGVDPTPGPAPSWWYPTAGGGPNTYFFSETTGGRFWQRTLDTAGGSPTGMVIRFAVGFDSVLPTSPCTFFVANVAAG